MPEPFISVIVPVRNGGAWFAQCLDALARQDYPRRRFETIVVDDASTDTSAEAARASGALVVSLPQQRGPAAARNRGARAARGEIFLFIDADVVAREDTLSRVAAALGARPDVSAVFGSYDDSPTAPNLVSQYKNLLHHFVHQTARREASTFWAGCGAVRREAFERVGGFDERRYARPSIEDIELGHRLRHAGCRILLDKELQAKHLKRWSLATLLRADVFDRAVPWSRLILESGEMPNDLNLRGRERVCAALVVLACASLVLAAVAALAPGALARWPLGLAAALVASVAVLNRGLYGFFLRRRGARFLVGAFALHLLYYLYSAAVFAACWLPALRRAPARTPADEAEAS